MTTPMRRIDLLPESYAARRRERQRVTAAVIVGLVVLGLLAFWWLMIGSAISDARNDLAEQQATNDRLRARIAELAPFGELAATIQAKEQALALVMQSDVDWPALMTEVAMVIPSEVWLTEMTLSAQDVEGETEVPTETAPVRVSERDVFGRIQFQGASLTMPGVAKWLLRLAGVNEFSGIYLNDATENENEAGTNFFDFDSTLELGRKALSKRFTRGTL